MQKNQVKEIPEGLREVINGANMVVEALRTEKKRIITTQSRCHKNNMIGQTNPTDHKKPVNRKKKLIIGKINKVEIVPNIHSEKIEVQLIGKNRAGELGFIIRQYSHIKNAIRFFKKLI